MDVEVITDTPFFKKGARIKGHEFHYTRLINVKNLHYALKVLRGNGIDGYYDGILYKNMFASYMHIHAASVPNWAKRFVRIAEKYKNKNCNRYIYWINKKGVYYNAR